MDKRPELNKDLTIKDFKDFYWYKTELVAFCSSERLDTRGGKIELAKRIESYLIDGERIAYKDNSRLKTSTFDWKKEKLTVHTIITDSYKNTENVRTFFKSEIGDRFKFNVQFMNWMKVSAGKTLEEAVKQWKQIRLEAKNNPSTKAITAQFEYNTYIRDFMFDNPTLSIKTAISIWNTKKTMRGDKHYVKSDLYITDKK